jgi:hypothetical protein
MALDRLGAPAVLLLSLIWDLQYKISVDYYAAEVIRLVNVLVKWLVIPTLPGSIVVSSRPFVVNMPDPEL